MILLHSRLLSLQTSKQPDENFSISVPIRTKNKIVGYVSLSVRKRMHNSFKENLQISGKCVNKGRGKWQRPAQEGGMCCPWICLYLPTRG